MTLKGNILAGKILVDPIDPADKTKHGLIIPDIAKEQPNIGTVALVGIPKHDEPVEVKVGDKVQFNYFAGQVITLEGHPYLILNQSDILFIYG